MIMVRNRSRCRPSLARWGGARLEVRCRRCAGHRRDLPRSVVAGDRRTYGARAGVAAVMVGAAVGVRCTPVPRTRRLRRAVTLSAGRSTPTPTGLASTSSSPGSTSTCPSSADKLRIPERAVRDDLPPLAMAMAMEMHHHPTRKCRITRWRPSRPTPQLTDDS